MLPEKERLNATEAELEFFKKYNKSLATYMTSVGLDLTVDHWPPKNTKLSVMMIIVFDDKLVSKTRDVHLKVLYYIISKIFFSI